jgi:hypothetical protein
MMSAIKHTPGMWRGGMYLGAAHEISQVRPNGDRIRHIADVFTADVRLIELAPTAPHDCDDPTCPGAVNKRRLDAWDDLAKVCRDMSEASKHPSGWYDAAVDALDRIDAILTRADEAAHPYVNGPTGPGPNSTLATGVCTTEIDCPECYGIGCGPHGVTCVKCDGAGVRECGGVALRSNPRFHGLICEDCGEEYQDD